MTTTSFFQNPSTKITLKLALIFLLVIFLLIPKYMILDLIDERQQLSEMVKNEVAVGWASDQIITSPTLVIPYNYITKDEKGKTVTSSKSNLILYPEHLDLNGNLDTQSKYRSLYKVLLYESKMNLKGKFELPELQNIGLKDANILYDQAYIAIGISDLKGIKNAVNLIWNGQKNKVSPGMNDVQFRYSNTTNITGKQPEYNEHGMSYYGVKTGMSTPVLINSTEPVYHFAFDLEIKGSHVLSFCPMAKNTTVVLKSPFPDPNFVGEFLPEHTTNSSGFDAKWNVLEYNKSLPAYQKANNIIDLGNHLFGVKIADPVDNYAKTHRAGKYMILFVILTFLVVFLTEIVERINIHIFQYTLIGLALSIFFTLLLSISEFWGFDLAYSGAATATIGLIFLYSLGMFKNKRSSALLLGLMVSLFAYIYIIIQLEKTALLAGSIGLFVIIALTMYVTRKIKWFEESNASQIENEIPN
jgi:inner membrane protein